MGRILVNPQRLEDASRTLRDTARDFQRITEILTRSIHQATWESSQKAQVERKLAEWHRISRMLVQTLEEQGGFLQKKAMDFRRTDEEVGRSISFGNMAASFASTIAFSKLQNVQGIKVSNPSLFSLESSSIKGSQDTTLHAVSGDLFAAHISQASGYNEVGQAVTGESRAALEFTDTAVGDIGAGISISTGSLFAGIDFGGEQDPEETALVKEKLQQFLKIS
ncbi:hypothetical protein MUG87_14405 [Ectobacillus sp. JY-23]|uniref:WXG100 family type VII secretion target n=1 Tax=Ectobacillus sp. JY-23 TaxID=2933872 RepID=UPI001FF6074A|nr:hypothetical protein [Ectobacillus sp. JY-23]UOY91674.1 hypothetical protein MUG87_14405 [Ectobacillus sp. JY-23]